MRQKPLIRERLFYFKEQNFVVAVQIRADIESLAADVVVKQISPTLELLKTSQKNAKQSRNLRGSGQ
jgi:hypothetical protein